MDCKPFGSTPLCNPFWSSLKMESISNLFCNPFWAHEHIISSKPYFLLCLPPMAAWCVLPSSLLWLPLTSFLATVLHGFPLLLDLPVRWTQRFPGCDFLSHSTKPAEPINGCHPSPKTMEGLIGAGLTLTLMGPASASEYLFWVLSNSVSPPMLYPFPPGLYMFPV